MNPREKDSDQNRNKFPKINTPPSRQWSSSFKNPRIVRVSRAFGGKDRHSKVCTVRGLRDRRIRLSVPTAIQLYDLQERLGLGQPSKVVDWLIEATKDEIDKLPPLPMMQLPSNLPLSLPEGRKTIDEKENIGQGFGGSFVEQNFFPMPNTPYNYNFHWDNHQPNMPLSQFGGGFPFLEEQYNSHVNPPFPSSYINPQSMESDQYLRQMQQNSTTLHLISPTMKSFSLSMNHPDENDNRKPEKGN